jgi:ATP-dependent DNA ligase
MDEDEKEDEDSGEEEVEEEGMWAFEEDALEEGQRVTFVPVARVGSGYSDTQLEWLRDRLRPDLVPWEEARQGGGGADLLQTATVHWIRRGARLRARAPTSWCEIQRKAL